MFARMKTSTKMFIGFMTAVAVLLIVGGIGYWGVSGLGQHIHHITQEHNPAIAGLNNINAGTQMVKTAMRTLMIPSISDALRKRQHEQIANGRKIYQEGRELYESIEKQADEAEMWKQCSDHLAKWREANQQALALYKQLEEADLGDTDTLRQVLEASRGDHWRGIAQTVKCVATGEHFDGCDDHTACAFGKWMAGFKTTNPAMLKILQECDEPHRQFHAAIKQIKQLVRDGKTEEAQVVLREKLEPASQKTLAAIAGMTDEVVRVQKLLADFEGIVFGPARDSQLQFETLLTKLRTINDKGNEAETALALSVAGWAKLLAIIALLVGTALSVVFALVLGRNINRSLRNTISQAEQLSAAAVEGKLQTRGNPESVPPEFRPIITGFNATLDAVIGPLNVAAGYVDRISKGDIPEKITAEYRGDFNEIKNNLNQCIDAINAMVADAEMLTEAAVAGKLQTRADAGKHQGDFRKIIEGVNSTLDAVIGPLNMAAGYVDRISRGDIPEKITDEYHGDFDLIKTNLNRCIDAINGLIAESTTLSQAAAEGRLDVRADAAKFQGKYHEIIAGMNAMLEGFAAPMRDIAAVMSRLGEKDFTQKIEKHYPGLYGELCNNVNAVVAAVRGAIEQIVESANQFAEGARVIAESSQTLAQGAQAQSSSVEEMTAAIEELARSVETVKESATAANAVAREANELANAGGRAVSQSIESMERIRQSSQKIAEIIQVISEIASQTNLLALNAAIEAARAGEHGMGFAVVADEVRKLAERSNQAAREISSLIKESTQRVEEGAQLSDQTGESLKKIIQTAETTAARIAEIASATVQQAANAQEVSKAIQTIAQVTEQSAAGSEEMASSSEELGAQATALRELVREFNVGAA